MSNLSPVPVVVQDDTDDQWDCLSRGQNRTANKTYIAPFLLGDTVMITGLKDQKHLNGSLGTYLGIAKEDEKHKVRLFNSAKEVVYVSGENLRDSDEKAPSTSHHRRLPRTLHAHRIISPIQVNKSFNESYPFMSLEFSRQLMSNNIKRVKLVPNCRMGEFIGRGGNEVRSLETRTGIMISVQRGPSKENPEMCEVYLIGPAQAVDQTGDVIDKFIKSNPAGRSVSKESSWVNEIFREIDRENDSKKSSDHARGVILTPGRSSLRSMSSAPSAFSSIKETPVSKPKSSSKHAIPGNLVTKIVFIPAHRSNEFIGVGGASISQFQEQSGLANTILSLSLSEIDPTMKELLLKGRASAVQKAINFVNLFLQSKPRSQIDSNNQTWMNLLEAEQSASREEEIAVATSEVDTSTEELSEEKRLLNLLLSLKYCFKCPVEQFNDWLHSEDICSITDLVDAFETPNFVKDEMQPNGLKGFKRFTLQEAAIMALKKNSKD